MTEVECLKQIRDLCYEHIRESEEIAQAIGHIAHLAQRRLVNLGAVDGVSVGNGEFVVNGRNMLTGDGV